MRKQTAFVVNGGKRDKLLEYCRWDEDNFVN